MTQYFGVDDLDAQPMSSITIRSGRRVDALTALVCLGLAWGCAPAASPPSPPCHPTVLPEAHGPTGVPLSCTDDFDCPPPLVCGVPDEPIDGSGDEGTICIHEAYGTEPELTVEAFDRPRLPIELSDPLQGDGLIIAWQAPANARQVRCAIFGCPMTLGMLRRGLERCVIFDVKRDTAQSDTITVTPRSQSSPTELDPVTRLATCGPEDLPVLYTVTELNLACWAFSDTQLVAVSSILRLSPRQLGRFRDRYIATDCAQPPVLPGAACLSDPDDPELGVCSGRRCCRPCWGDAQCADHQSRCVPVEADAEADEQDKPGPFIGVCAGSCREASEPSTESALPDQSPAGEP